MSGGESPGALNRIALHVERRVERWKEERPLDALRRAPLYGAPRLDLAAALVDSSRPMRIIAEVKFASPSEGFLRPREEATAERAAGLAAAYAAAGAAAVSILTERNFFAGDPGFLVAARASASRTPLLMKDFVLDPYQLELARASGADAVLLVVALLRRGTAAMLARAQALGLAALVEAHTEAEVELALACGAKIIGVNSRDLKTLKTDLDVARGLAPRLKGCVAVAESGLSGRAELNELAGLGYRAFLIGSSFMREPDPAAALARLLS